MLCIWLINKNIIAQVTKYFPNPEQLKNWISLQYKICQAFTLHKYKSVKIKLQIKNFFKIAKNRKSLYEYVDGKYPANENNYKYYYFQTNQIIYFTKRITSTAEEKHTNMKKVFKNTFGNFSKIVKIIQKKFKDKLRKIHFQYIYNQNSNIKASLDIGMFCYLWHEIINMPLILWLVMQQI